ncbi:expressed unknown protein [Seminavis robusta]|uniref:Uncharacterized protein n=1 Tax=Seminavis robusta TaxID=568900 RepID=A0A9N8DNZ1_9STRA|nr:expressed unknown protein [Seminavis robusta]|eukprot:Sro251_g099410.1 n/a (176) ;mRNA; f:74609-75136
MKSSLWTASLMWLACHTTEAFQPCKSNLPLHNTKIFAQQDPKATEEEEEDLLAEADARLSDILPPAVSFSRNSILFSEKPVTQRDNDVLAFWRGMKATVPPVITGAWPWRDPYLADENPMTAFYNILFVRLPVIAMALVYAKNLKEGHPLVMDYGDGPFEVSPIAVLVLVAIILA